MPKLAESAALHSRVLSAIRDYAVFALDAHGTIQSWSPGAERLTGYADDEVIGRSYSIFGAQESEADLARILETAQATGAFQQERWWRHRDGRLVWVDELINPLDDDNGFAIVTRDLTQRVEDEERQNASRVREAEGVDREHVLRSELQAAERRAAFLAEASSILVATSLDFESTLRALVRLAVSRLADWSVIHSLGEQGTLRRTALAHRDPRSESGLEKAVDHLSEKWSRAVKSVVGTGQAQVLDSRSTAGWFGDADAIDGIGHGAAMITPLMGRGNVLGALTCVKASGEYDDDDLALAEELGRRAAIALDNARLYRDAQDANRAKADFLAVMSHELRTPLNAIMGYSDLLDAEISGELSDKQRRQVDRIRSSARHLLQLIEEILSFARIEAGGEEVRLDVVDAGQIADEAAAVILPMAESKDLEFRLDVEEPGVRLETDAGKVRQVLVNLLSNAVKFTERGSVVLRVRQQGERAVFDIIDTGVGIPADEIERIFDPFWQVERPNTRRVGGTGLGLSVSRRYIRLLHGELEVESEPGRGTHFSVILPLRLTGAKATHG